MNKFLVFLFGLFGLTAGFLLLNKNSSVQKNSDSPLSLGNPEDPSSYLEWNRSRLADPATGEIPKGIRQAELAFASTLPKNYSRSLSWNLIGPKNLGGRTRAFAFDVRNEDIVLTGGVTSGIWKSTDGMSSFYKTTDAAQMHSLTTIAQDTRPGKEDVWYAGTGEYYNVTSIAAFTATYSGNGIFKSTDNGETWTQLPSTMSNTPETGYTNGDMDFVWRIVTDHTDTLNDVVLAAVFNGVYRSADGGISWTPVLGLDTSLAAASDYVDLIKTPSGIFYAALSSDGPDKGIYRSEDGINWNSIQTAAFPASYRRWTLAVNPTDENEIMLVGETPSTGLNGHSLWRYRYLSGDGSGAGGTWSNLSSRLPDGTCTGYFNFDFGYFHTQNSYDMCIAYHPTNDSILFLGGTNLYRSTTGFTTTAATSWIGGYKCTPADPFDYVYDNHHPDQHGLYFYPSNPNKAVSINDGGIFVTNDITAPNVTWTIMNNNYVTSQFYTVAMEAGDVSTDFMVGGAQDNGTWFTNANHLDSLWKWVFRGDGSFAAIPEGRPYYLMSIQQGKIYKVGMNDVGDTTLATRVDPNISNTPNFINPFLIDPLNNNRVYEIQGNKIQRNDIIDQIPLTGEIYDTLKQGWNAVTGSTLSLGYSYTAIEMSPASPNTLYLGTQKTKLYKIYRANTSTSTRVDITSPLFPANANISSISVSPYDSLEILVTFSNYRIKSIFYSNDGGISFSNISGNLEEATSGAGSGPAVYWGEIYPSSPSTIFVGTSTGLYSTTIPNDTNTVWTQEGPTTIGNMHVNMIVSRPYDGKILIATHGNGFYSAYLPPAVIGVKENKSELFAKIYPNPATEYVNIEYVVPNGGKTTIDIYDISGKKVYTEQLFVSKGQKIDRRINTNDFASLQSGTYLIGITNGSHRKTSKIIIRK